jgi:hypothetical protein
VYVALAPVRVTPRAATDVSHACPGSAENPLTENPEPTYPPPCAGQSFGGAVRRNLKAHEREQSLLVAQSVLAQVRVTPTPWKPEETGSLEGGWLWRVEVAPLDAAANERSPWRTFAVTVHLTREGSNAKEVVLRSIELARTTP